MPLKSNPKTNVKSNSKTNPKINPKTPKTNPKTNLKTKSKSNPKTNFKTLPKINPKTHPKTNPKTHPKTKFKANPKINPKSNIKTNPNPNLANRRLTATQKRRRRVRRKAKVSLLSNFGKAIDAKLKSIVAADIIKHRQIPREKMNEFLSRLVSGVDQKTLNIESTKIDRNANEGASMIFIPKEHGKLIGFSYYRYPSVLFCPKTL